MKNRQELGTSQGVETWVSPEGNHWFEFPSHQTQAVIEPKLKHSRLVISRHFVGSFPAEERRRLLRLIHQDSLRRDVLSKENGAEALVHILREKNGSFFKRSTLPPLAVEKTYTNKSVRSPLGWEMFRVYEYLRQALSTEGFRMADVFGATDQALYLNYYEGPTLDKVNLDLAHLDWRQNPILDTMVLNIHQILEKALDQYLFNLGYRKIRESSALLDNYRELFMCPDGHIVETLIDVYEILFCNRYRNLIVTDYDQNELGRAVTHGNRAVYDFLKTRTVVVDPVLICAKTSK